MGRRCGAPAPHSANPAAPACAPQRPRVLSPCSTSQRDPLATRCQVMDIKGQEFPKLGSAPSRRNAAASKGKKQKAKGPPVTLQPSTPDDVQSTPWAQIVRGRTPACDSQETPSAAIGSSMEAVALCTPQAEASTTAEPAVQQPVAAVAHEPVAAAAAPQLSLAGPLVPGGTAIAAEEPEHRSDRLVVEGDQGREATPAEAPSSAAAPPSATADADGGGSNSQPPTFTVLRQPAVLVHKEPQGRQKQRLPKPSPKRASSQAHPSPPGSPEAAGGRGLQPGASAHRHKKQTTGSDAREPRRQAGGTGAGHGRSWQPARTVPQRCYFEDALPLRLPPGPALAALDHCLHGFVRRTVHQARQVDAPACARSGNCR